MTAGAVGSEFAVVNIVRFVAIGTVTAQLHLGCQRLPVARFAINARVCAFELESSLCVVIENRLPPIDRVVAQRALFAEASVVAVVFLVAVDALLGRVPEHMRVMTILALALIVLSEQGEAGQAMVEEHVVLPGYLVVTIRAGGAQRRVVSIVVFMTGQAVRSQRDVEDRLDVARHTLDVSVRSVQGMAGINSMIESHFRPAGTRVARIALLAEVAFVVVVFQVAANAFHRELVRERVFAVACIAFLLRVFAVEQEARITIVIKTRVIPAQRTVTVAAFIAAAPIVSIILGMTTETRRRCIRKRVVSVTVEAGRPLVLADQGIAGRFVIELDFHPVIW